MILEYLLFLLLGIAAGAAAGLLPGLHVNNIGMMSLSLIPLLSLDITTFAVFLTAMATTQTFIDFIPSIFLGVPDEDTVLSLLPAHRLLLEGRAMEAVRLTGAASLYGLFITLLLLPIAFVIMPLVYTHLRSVIAPVLVFAISYLVLRESGFEKRAWALAVIALSGYLGYVSMNMTALSDSQVFLPMFSGLFGLSTLTLGLFTPTKSYPQDAGAGIEMKGRGLWGNSLLGAVGGALVGLLPAMSPSQIGIMLQEGRALRGRAKDSLEDINIRGFLATVASLNTADAMFSIFSLYLLGNPRSGISVMIQDLFGSIDLGFLALLCGVMIVSGLVAYKLHIYLGWLFTDFVDRIDLRKLSLAGILLVSAMVFAVTGVLGLLIALVATATGLIPALVGVSRTHCMGCLLLPTLIFFLGI